MISIEKLHSACCIAQKWITTILENVFDPRIVNRFKTEGQGKLLNYTLSDEDTPIIRQFKAILNILNALEILSDSSAPFSLQERMRATQVLMFNFELADLPSLWQELQEKQQEILGEGEDLFGQLAKLPKTINGYLSILQNGIAEMKSSEPEEKKKASDALAAAVNEMREVQAKKPPTPPKVKTKKKKAKVKKFAANVQKAQTRFEKALPILSGEKTKAHLDQIQASFVAIQDILHIGERALGANIVIKGLSYEKLKEPMSSLLNAVSSLISETTELNSQALEDVIVSINEMLHEIFIFIEKTEFNLGLKQGFILDHFQQLFSGFDEAIQKTYFYDGLHPKFPFFAERIEYFRQLDEKLDQEHSQLEEKLLKIGLEFQRIFDNNDTFNDLNESELLFMLQNLDFLKLDKEVQAYYIPQLVDALVKAIPQEALSSRLENFKKLNFIENVNELLEEKIKNALNPSLTANISWFFSSVSAPFYSAYTQITGFFSDTALSRLSSAFRKNRDPELRGLELQMVMVDDRIVHITQQMEKAIERMDQKIAEKKASSLQSSEAVLPFIGPLPARVSPALFTPQPSSPLQSGTKVPTDIAEGKVSSISKRQALYDGVIKARGLIYQQIDTLFDPILVQEFKKSKTDGDRYDFSSEDSAIFRNLKAILNILSSLEKTSSAQSQLAKLDAIIDLINDVGKGLDFSQLWNEMVVNLGLLKESNPSLAEQLSDFPTMVRDYLSWAASLIPGSRQTDENLQDRVAGLINTTVYVGTSQVVSPASETESARLIRMFNVVNTNFHNMKSKYLQQQGVGLEAKKGIQQLSSVLESLGNIVKVKAKNPKIGDLNLFYRTRTDIINLIKALKQIQFDKIEQEQVALLLPAIRDVTNYINEFFKDFSIFIDQTEHVLGFKQGVLMQIVEPYFKEFGAFVKKANLELESDQFPYAQDRLPALQHLQSAIQSDIRLLFEEDHALSRLLEIVENNPDISKLSEDDICYLLKNLSLLKLEQDDKNVYCDELLSVLVRKLSPEDFKLSEKLVQSLEFDDFTAGLFRKKIIESQNRSEAPTLSSQSSSVHNKMVVHIKELIHDCQERCKPYIHKADMINARIVKLQGIKREEKVAAIQKPPVPTAIFPVQERGSVLRQGDAVQEQRQPIRSSPIITARRLSDPPPRSSSFESEYKTLDEAKKYVEDVLKAREKKLQEELKTPLGLLTKGTKQQKITQLGIYLPKIRSAESLFALREIIEAAIKDKTLIAGTFSKRTLNTLKALEKYVSAKISAQPSQVKTSARRYSAT